MTSTHLAATRVSSIPHAAAVGASIRRKPKITYQSPSAHLPISLRIEGPTISLKLAGGSKPVSSKVNLNTKPNVVGLSPKRKKYAMGPPLPLYHPLGRLAMSLPELDATSMNLPTGMVDSSGRRSSARARRPAAKLRDTEEAVDEVGEGKEKAGLVVSSPRKKRGSGATALGGKRKRKEVDDGDATYPAKRTTRNVRNGSASEEVGSVVGGGEVEVVDGMKEKKGERRTTRSRSGLGRRESSGSEGTSGERGV